MTESNVDGIPDYVKKMDESEVSRRAALARNPPVSLSDECRDNLRGLIPELAKLDKAMAVDKSFHPRNIGVYCWLYLQLRRDELKSVARRLLAGIVGYAILRKLVPVLKDKFSNASIGELAAVALKIDFWSSLSIGFAVPVLLLLCLRGRDMGEDAMRRVLCMYLLGAFLLLLASLAVSTGAVRAALAPSTFVRFAIIPGAIWFWNDLRRDIATSSSLVSPLFSAWKWLAALCVCCFGGVLRTAILATHQPAEAFALLGGASSALRESIGNRFPVALSLLLDCGGLQFLVFIAYAACFLYGAFVVVAGTNFLTIRNHRAANLPVANWLAAKGFYSGSSETSSRRFMSTAPENVKSYRPSSVMLLEKVEGLLASDSPLLGKEERPAFLDLLDYEKVVTKEKDIKEWMPPRNQFLVADDKLSERDIKVNGLLTWARPLSEKQTEMSFAQFFETLDENDYEYDPNADKWSFTTEAPMPDAIDVKNASVPPNDLEQEKKSPSEGDDPDTVFV